MSRTSRTPWPPPCLPVTPPRRRPLRRDRISNRPLPASPAAPSRAHRRPQPPNPLIDYGGPVPAVQARLFRFDCLPRRPDGWLRPAIETPEVLGHRGGSVQTRPLTRSFRHQLRVHFQRSQHQLLPMARYRDLQRRHLPGGQCSEPGAAAGLLALPQNQPVLQCPFRRYASERSRCARVHGSHQTDPRINAWYDKRGAEIADKCDFNYQSCVRLSTGSWQIQSEWSNATNSCRQQ